MCTKPADRKKKSQGMNWISQHKRLAIYLRDGLACAYCGSSVEEGTKLTLDHLQPYSEGGSNKETNLVTACHKCNSSRGNRSVEDFAAGVAAYVDRQAAQIVEHVYTCAARSLPLWIAKDMVSRRGSCLAALQELM